MTRPALSIVPDPDTRLRGLFAERDELARKLASVDEEIAAGVKRYSDERGYCVPLRKEAVRRELDIPLGGGGMG